MRSGNTGTRDTVGGPGRRRERRASNAEPNAETRLRRRLKTAAVVCAFAAGLLLLAAAGTAGVVADDDGPPDVPASYYGEVEVDGEPAETGTEIDAVVDGEVRDTITVEEAGEYGGPGLDDEKLVVEDADSGDVVEFEINGEPADETVEWESGDVQEVDLTFDDVPDDSDDDAGDADDGSGDDAGSGTGAGADDGSDDAGTDDSDDTDAGDDDDAAADDAEVDDDADDADADEAEVIEEAESTIESDDDGASATFDGNASVESVTFDDDGTEGSVTVSEYDGEPAETGSSPGGTVSVTQISVPDDVTDTSATVRTAVDLDRVDEIDGDAEDLRINRHVDGEWRDLETDIVDETDDEVVLEAETPGFSYFSVSAVSEPEARLAAIEPADVGAEVTLDASDSTDRYGEIVAYEWTIDGESLAGETATTTIDVAGEYEVELTVRNDAGETDTITETLVVEEADGDETPADTPAEETPDEPAGFDVPGFGVVVALAALLVAALIAARSTR